MLQLFQVDVTKVHEDVAYVAMVIHVCCKLFFPNFSVVFPDVYCQCIYLNVAHVSYICCMCFIWMLHIFLQCYFQAFSGVLQVF
jgi:hypothetical protein